jgi:alpha-L-fucosidase
MKKITTPKKIKWILLAIMAGLPLLRSAAAEMEIVPGKFTGTMDSLTNYVCPDWFRDAKFGIWAHWGPQAVPMEGDWYARKMYQQGSDDYNDHLARWGHPSTNGWKDIIPLWHAEHWDPARLMALYKKAGAKYFVSMGVHHDNFDLWDSKFHWWNAVNVGPHRDVVGEWQREAKKNGLPFGVSEHLGASFNWFQTSHGADQTGRFAGVPYDGANPANDELYHPPMAPGDKDWYTRSGTAQQEWFNRINDLLEHYQPDLLYSDGGLPFGEVGRTLVANFYNRSMNAHDGKLTAVYNCKSLGSGEFVAGTCVQDVERGVMPGINPLPWQTDTSIGDWFYNKHWKYQPIDWTVHMLVDIVSKNGNLLLNVVLRPDGTLDPEVETMLGRLSDWFAINGEAIYGTRPWLVFGEGPANIKGGAFKEDFNFSAKDIRFTTKGKILYAITLGWPDDGKVVIRSLARPAAGGNEIQRVELLGYQGKINFTQTSDALTVELPAQKISDLTCTLKITGTHLQPVTPPATATVIQPDAGGKLTLSAADAERHGSQLQLETQGGLPDIGFWNNGQEWVSWTANAARAGAFKVSATVATTDADASFAIEVGDQTLIARPPLTGGWNQFQTIDLGEIKIRQPGNVLVKIRANDAANWKPINLNSVHLIPTE